MYNFYVLEPILVHLTRQSSIGRHGAETNLAHESYAKPYYWNTLSQGRMNDKKKIDLTSNRKIKMEFV
jgi:hypothetical protein